MSEQANDNAGIPFPPPLVYAAGLVVGIAGNLLFPMRFIDASLTMYIGFPLMLVGFVIGGLALSTMLRAGTSPDPNEPTRRFLTAGPFAFTRNPIYLAFAIVYFGFTITFNSLLALVLLPLAVFVIERLVIVREEKYLERKFGDAYVQYKTRVRRWL